jgi:hypothetical protein
MEEPSVENQQVVIQLESSSLRVAPGSSYTLPLFLHNQSPADGNFALTVTGIPSNWVSVPAPVIRLGAGEQRQTSLTIQPPSSPPGRAGRYQVVVRAASQETPQQAAEATCTLAVAALEVPGRIGVLLAATEFPVAPGDSVVIPLVLFNQGLEGDSVSLSVAGIPSSWVYASSASTLLLPGQQQEVTLTIRPTPSGESGAGRHPFKIHAASQANPGQVTVAECALVIAGFSRFRVDLTPQRIEAGTPARVTVENQGNVDEIFTLTLKSPDDGLEFEPLATQQLHIPPGEMEMAQFSAKPRSRPLLGTEWVLPFTTRVQAAGGGTRNVNGEVVGKPLIPSWVLPALLVGLLVIACIAVLAIGLGASGDGAPSEAPASTVPADQEQPAEPPPEQPAEPPPEEQPAEPPPEEQPAEPPPEEQPTGLLLPGKWYGTHA